MIPIAPKLEYAGFWIRTLATIIDSLILAVALGLLYGFFHGDADLLISGDGFDDPLDFILTWILPAVAIILFWNRLQATPGKILLKMKIADVETGGKPTAGQFIGRYLAYFIAFLPLCLGVIWVGIDKRKQGWHDKLAGTVVIRQTGSLTIEAETPDSKYGQNFKS